jgi:hypothetical protein
MEFVCRRCEQVTRQRPYRVTTKDEERVVLSMLVCPSCARLAKSLGLATVRMATDVEGTTGVEQRTVRTRASIRGAALRLSRN